ncbi:MAG: hypothetical protein WC548_04340 [Candidatus Pacearchaeota archaeon]
MLTSVKNLVAVIAVIGGLTCGLVHAVEPIPAVVDGNEVWMITEGNVDPNTGNAVWLFASNRKYMLANDVVWAVSVEDVNNVEIQMNNKAIRGNWNKEKESQGISFTNCHNISVSDGRVVGFSIGVWSAYYSTGIRFDGVTSIGIEEGLFLMCSRGAVEFNDCVFGATEGDGVISHLVVTYGTILVNDCVFVGGTVSSNSKDVVFQNCEFDSAVGSDYTEINE